MSKFSENLYKLDSLLADFYEDNLSIGELRLLRFLIMAHNLVRSWYDSHLQSDK